MASLRLPSPYNKPLHSSRPPPNTATTPSQIKLAFRANFILQVKISMTHPPNIFPSSSPGMILFLARFSYALQPTHPSPSQLPLQTFFPSRLINEKKHECFDSQVWQRIYSTRSSLHNDSIYFPARPFVCRFVVCNSIAASDQNKLELDIQLQLSTFNQSKASQTVLYPWVPTYRSSPSLHVSTHSRVFNPQFMR